MLRHCCQLTLPSQYFKVDRFTGTYYEKPTDKKEKDAFDMREVTTVTDSKDAKEKNEFVVNLKNRTMTLKAASPVEKAQWVNVFKSYEGLGSKPAGTAIPVPEYTRAGLITCMDFINAYGALPCSAFAHTRPHHSCVCACCLPGLKQPGIFRESGGASQVDALYKQFLAGACAPCVSLRVPRTAMQSVRSRSPWCRQRRNPCGDRGEHGDGRNEDAPAQHARNALHQ